jgi:hypothetical protein
MHDDTTNVVVNLAEFLAKRRAADELSSAVERELALLEPISDSRLERQATHRRRMLEHLTQTTREYA